MTITPGTLARMAGHIAAGLVAPQTLYEGAARPLTADYQRPVATVARRAIEIAQEIAKQLGMTVADPTFHEK